MKILKNIVVPTGNILIVQGEKGKLECLSLGDYGKDINLKADFLGLGREPKQITHTKLLPLEKKWVATISTQYGCSSGCSFCDVPKVGKGVNASFNDIKNQLLKIIELHPEVKTSERLNIHFARMGEPTWNPNVLEVTKWMKAYIDPTYKIHPVVSTMMPKNNEWLKTFISSWMIIKNRILNGEAGLQISINSTDDEYRDNMFRGSSLRLEEIAKITDHIIPNGRKITLNFALGNWPIDGDELLKYFNPDYFLCKLTPLHKTKSVNNKNLMPSGDFTKFTPYSDIEKSLKKAGYDVIVFIASKEEDESRITCGNAILSEKDIDKM
jgi:23S rRNA (adenine2503-C2)-methyltransferase